jgi:LPS-assembly lipoprotein
MDLGIAGRRAAVAASSTGLGYATAAALVEAGVTVAVCSRDRERIEAAAARLGPLAIPLVADVATEAGAAAFVADSRDALGGIDIQQIDAPKGTDEERLAVEVRNALMFGLNGGGSGGPQTHRLKISMSSTRATIIVDINTQRPDIENYGINASYVLTEVATGKQVVAGTTFARVSYDIPGQQQRYARIRGLRDAESRAAKVIADNIRSRLASYFVAGT